MNAVEWMQILALGGFAGAVGQGARMVIGIKQAHDQAAVTAVAAKDLISLPQLTLEMVIGFIAGALAAMATNLDPHDVDPQHLLGLLAAGYAGTDFIQGLMTREVPVAPAAMQASAPVQIVPPAPVATS